ncbi:4-diphosphocytidyl-2-C-methyl-D-erythritol kinase [Eggerthella sp. CAG:209]|nr:4-diphosphocytidyl-2-C-methyl-D-erythritol kinase [Eggerthella sp. CAG:209]
MRLEGLPMKNVTKIISPAKVNLVLAVGEKQENGFHEVQTIMHSLALHDTLSMRRFDDEGSGDGLQVMLKCESSFTIDPLLIKAEENIAYKAVVELAKALGRTQDETIEMILNKVIPAEAGLGGGSSNAAAALVGAATLWGVGVEDERVQEVASRLGADVSFFLKGGCARLSGKGDVFEAQLEPRSGFVLLVRPDAGVSTGKAYAAFDDDPILPGSEYLSSLAGLDAAADVSLYNNLEKAACSVTPVVAQVLEWGRAAAGEENVVLCGSGSAVCCIFDSYQAACEASVEARKHEWWTRVTSFSPLGAAIVEAL